MLKRWFGWLILLGCLPFTVQAEEPSPLAKHAVQIQALAVDSVVSVTRFDLKKIDPAVITDLMGKLVPAETDDSDAVQTALQAIPAVLQTLQSKLAEAGISEFYQLKFEDGQKLTVFPASELGDPQKAGLSAFAAAQSADYTLVERFGFLILATTAEEKELAKKAFTEPNKTPRPTLTAGLAATEGGACSIVWINPDNLFDIPKIGKISPLAKEQVEKMTYATLTFSMVETPRAVVLIKASDENMMKDIADSITLLIEAVKTDSAMIENMVDAETAASLGAMITLISNGIQTQVEKDQMMMTLDLGPIAQGFFSGSPAE